MRRIAFPVVLDFLLFFDFGIASASSASISVEVQAAGSVVVIGGLRLSDSTKQYSSMKVLSVPLELHAEWLRERCQSPAMVEVSTSQPMLSPHEYETPRVLRAEIVDTDEAWNFTQWLRVEFADGHISSFEVFALARKAIAERMGDVESSLVQVERAEVPRVRTWNASSFDLYSVDFSRLKGSSAAAEWAKLQVLREMLSTGIVLVRGVPQKEGECVKIANLLSTLRMTEWGPQFDVKSGSDSFDLTATTAATDGRENEADAETEARTKGDQAEKGGSAGSKKLDLAYSGHRIGMHTDNPYRYPTPDFQLLHAIEHCECAEPQEMYEGGCAECTIVNYFADAFSIAENLPARYFDILASTPVRFENDGGGGQSALWHLAPIIEKVGGWAGSSFDTEASEETQRCRSAECIKAIRYSAKSGGYAKLQGKYRMGEMDTFYAARRLFSEMANEKAHGFRTATQFRPGDMIIFDNQRILHSRSKIAPSDGRRHVQGCYLDRDGAKYNQERLRRRVMEHFPRSNFTSLATASKEEIDSMTAQYKEACSGEKLASRSLSLLKQLDSPGTMLGAPISLYEHSLQTATRAYRARENEETVVIALLHDIGELFSPSAHGDFVAGLLLPYITPESYWVLKMHEIFQGFHYFHRVGGNRTLREAWSGHEHYDACVRFCDLYDQASFDYSYTSLPLETFVPMVINIFSRKAYWWDPTHPKAVAVTGSDAEITV